MDVKKIHESVCESMKFVLASNNAGKRDEIMQILSSCDMEIITAKEAGFGSIDPEENGETFAQNAEIKARAFCELTNMPCIADDSGLCVDAMNGGPGVHTARYAGDHDFESGIERMLAELDGVPAEKRTARFVCSICCVWPDGRKVTAEGVCEGFIAERRMGDGGFGFDPIFLLPDGRCFAAIPAEDKNAVSHRGKALEELLEKLSRE